jgi:NarL family two-component system response regulator LiaR
MGDNNCIRVMVVDDHPMVRDGLKVFLLVSQDMELVGEAGNGEEALAVCAEVQPDVVLMDLKMPGMDGVAAIRAIRERCPGVQIIALTSFSERDLVQRAMQAGAISYLLKDVSAEGLAEAIRAAHAGRSTLSPEAAQALIQATTPTSQVGHNLTSREREVLALLADGLSNAQIGEQLNVTPSTVNYHVGNILAKLGVANRTEAATMAVQQGLIP